MNYSIKNVISTSELLECYSFFEDIFKGQAVINNPEYSFSKWEDRLKSDSELMLYASLNDEIIGIVFARVSKTNSITLGPVAVHEEYRGNNIASEMVSLLEKRAKNYDFDTIDLGAVESAEKFYQKLGYTPYLLIQSEDHAVEKLLTLKTTNRVEYTNVYDNKVSQVCLELKDFSSNIRSKYECAFPGCHTMIMYKKKIN